MMSSGATHELLDIGVISPEPKSTKGLGVGEVGYLITGVKDVLHKNQAANRKSAIDKRLAKKKK